MKVNLIDHTQNAAVTIGKAAAICYDAATNKEACIKRAKHCIDKSHLSTLRFAYATFNISGISRVCSHQLVRIAHAGILQESQRYVEQFKIEYVKPPGLLKMPKWFKLAWDAHLAISDYLYLSAIKLGMKKEDARYILPQACTTQLNITGNFQMWRDLLNNRTKKSAQFEIREVATAIQNELHKVAPEIFKEIQ